MAYGFGSGVRPELGATDYSNYLRGALSGAQMQAQGGAAMAAGVQNALAGVGEGIQKFQQNQQEIAAMAGDVKGMTQANPYLLESLDPKQMKVLESIRDGDSVKKKDMLEVYGAISAQNKMQQQQAAAQSQAVQDALKRAQIRDIERQAVEEERSAALEEQIQQVISLNTDPSGNINTETLLPDFISMGIPSEIALNRVSKILSVSPSGAAREDERLTFARDANLRAENAANASAKAAAERSRVDQLANKGISIFNKGEDEFNEFLETLSPQDQGIVLTQVKQFQGATPAESKLTAGAIADIMMERVENDGLTFGEYLSKLRQASDKIVEQSGDEYVVEGWWNDIDKIPAFEELIRQFPQFKVPLKIDQETTQLPSGGIIRRTTTQK
jgi:hypothetical protein